MLLFILESSIGTVAGPRPAGGSSLRPQPMVVANSPHAARNPAGSPRGGGGGGMDLRKRVVPNPGQQSLNQSMSMPASRKEVRSFRKNIPTYLTF